MTSVSADLTNERVVLVIDAEGEPEGTNEGSTGLSYPPAHGSRFPAFERE